MKKLLLLLFLPLILISCPKENDPNGDPGEFLAEAWIDSYGGTLETADVTLTVPPGTFTATHSVRIAIEKEYTDDFGGNAVTPVYRVTGIPSVTSGPMTLEIRLEGTPEDETYIAMGNGYELLEPEEEVVTYALRPATVTNGSLVAGIPILTGEPAEGDGLKSALFHPNLYMVFTGLSRMKETGGAYFNFSYPSAMDQQKLLQLAGYLHEAMDAYVEMNLADREALDAAVDLMGRPTVVITNRDMTGPYAWTVDMPQMNRISGNDPMAGLDRYAGHGNIRLNTTRSAVEQSPPEVLKSMAYMWVYRMICYFYLGDRMDWYTYATALYMKEKFAGVTDYTPDLFSSRGKSPFGGMEAGKELYAYVSAGHSVLGGVIPMQERWHAMGMYPFIRYLDRRYPDDKTLFSRIIMETVRGESGTSMEGIINALEEPEYEWWPGFFEQYLTRQLADIQAEEFTNLVESGDVIEFDKEANASASRSAEYADLSAGLYRINFLFSEFQNESSLKLKAVCVDLQPEYLTAMAFGLKDNTLTYLDDAADLTIGGLKTLKSGGTSSILVVVASSYSEPGADERLDIELQTRLRSLPEDFAFKEVQLSLQCMTNFSYSAGGTSQDRFDYLSDKRTGSMTGDLFTAVWDESATTGKSGTIEVEFDPAQFPFQINRFSVDAENTGVWWANPSTGEWVHANESFTASGEHLTLEEYNMVNNSGYRQHYFTIRVYGTDACSHLTGVNHAVRDEEMNLIREGDGTPVCDAQSDLWITLYCTDDGTLVGR
ncbi:MAG TPA: hypothetical protein ENO20_13435 [Bacteroides sp.]|nr:hypothetical protein [Bacteroides sp.]